MKNLVLVLLLTLVSCGKIPHINLFSPDDYICGPDGFIEIVIRDMEDNYKAYCNSGQVEITEKDAVPLPVEMAEKLYNLGYPIVLNNMDMTINDFAFTYLGSGMPYYLCHIKREGTELLEYCNLITGEN